MPRCIVEFFERNKNGSHQVEVRVLANGTLDVQQMIRDLNITELIDIKELIMFYFKF